MKLRSISCCISAFFVTLIASSSSIKAQNKYQPYFELGGAKYFNQKSSTASIYDLFIPLLQKDNQLFFTDLRILDRSGSSFEGNAHIGYRKLYSATKQIIGIYGAFDRRHSDNKNIFNQLTLGFEYWQNKLFIGGNIYRVVGENIQPIKEITIEEKQKAAEKNIARLKLKDRYYEQAVSGIDAELGYVIIDNLTTYVGGYYFASKDTDTIVGPKIRLIYDFKPTNKHILVV
ncbi:MAG: inverse autotransporter beta domain-containing protein [bacterium]